MNKVLQSQPAGTESCRLDKLLRAVMIAGPCAILAIAFLWLAIKHGAAGMFQDAVHENGERTFMQTVLYPTHFLRELPICFFSGLFTTGAFLLHAPVPEKKNANVLRWRATIIAGAVAAGLALTAALAVWHIAGISGLRLELLQYHTRGDLAEFGSHWGYHFLHLVFVFWASLALALFYRDFSSCTSHRISFRPGATLVATSLVLFAVCSVFFRLHTHALTDPLYLAHQVREIGTHGSVTIPLCIGALAILESRLMKDNKMPDSRTHSRFPRWGWIIALIVAAMLTGGTLIALMGKNVMQHAQQPGNYSALIAAHYFEHSFDYVFTVAWSLVIYGICAPRISRHGKTD